MGGFLLEKAWGLGFPLEKVLGLGHHLALGLGFPLEKTLRLGFPLEKALGHPRHFSSFTAATEHSFPFPLLTQSANGITIRRWVV